MRRADGWHAYLVGTGWSANRFRQAYGVFEARILIPQGKGLLLNLGVGGSWCGAPDATTPNAEMLVDWVRVR